MVHVATGELPGAHRVAKVVVRVVEKALLLALHNHYHFVEVTQAARNLLSLAPASLGPREEVAEVAALVLDLRAQDEEVLAQSHVSGDGVYRLQQLLSRRGLLQVGRQCVPALHGFGIVGGGHLRAGEVVVPEVGVLEALEFSTGHLLILVESARGFPICLEFEFAVEGVAQKALQNVELFHERVGMAAGNPLMAHENHHHAGGPLR
mmetsp:Transcript_33357/g.109307  ORF Transcript_33357/g.109307 Transcript_33357/m.109307 type:complete len:207 (-) Transcript_33357:213-833(-)